MKYNVVITAGGTSEKIDNVRKITNSGTGKLGSIIAKNLILTHDEDIEKIYYICSNSSYKPTGNKIEIIQIDDTNSLEKAVQNILKTKKIDYFIHSMAVSDYTVDYITTSEDLALEIDSSNLKTSYVINNYKKGIKDNKISSSKENLIIKLKKTPKIISNIKKLSPTTFLVGFKLLDKVEISNLLNVAIKLKDKNDLDIVVANDLETIRHGKHEAFIIKKDNSYVRASGKDEIALKLIDELFNTKKESYCFL